jgi:hypothetical protein
VYHFVQQLIIYNSNVVLDSSDLYLSVINKQVCIYWFQMRDLKIAVHMIYPNTFPSPHVDQLAEKSLFCWNKNLINSYKSKLFDIVNLLFWGEEAIETNGGFHNLQGTSFLNYKLELWSSMYTSIVFNPQCCTREVVWVHNRFG